MGALLGTGFWRFKSDGGIDGLAKINGHTLELLAVVARDKNKGHFKSFIFRAKGMFESVCVWHDGNPIIGKALAKYGFSRVVEERDGEKIPGWRWP